MLEQKEMEWCIGGWLSAQVTHPSENMHSCCSTHNIGCDATRGDMYLCHKWLLSSLFLYCIKDAKRIATGARKACMGAERRGEAVCNTSRFMVVMHAENG